MENKGKQKCQSLRPCQTHQQQKGSQYTDFFGGTYYIMPQTSLVEPIFESSGFSMHLLQAVHTE